MIKKDLQKKINEFKKQTNENIEEMKSKSEFDIQ